MTKPLQRFGGVVLVGGAILLLATGASMAQYLPELNVVGPGGERAHIFPTVDGAQALAAYAPDPGPLLYHSGGLVMQTATFYAIFWVPPHLQTGGPTSMSAGYQAVQTKLLTDYPAHGIDNNNTQYYQTIGTVTSFVQNVGSFGGSFVDTSNYPASGCTDTATPGACITDAQIRAEITKVMGIKGWTSGPSKMFLLFTSSGEGSCMSGTSSACAYTAYCAYHSFFGSASSPVIYGNEPFGNTTVCQAAGIPSPNGNPQADTAASTASHEMSEAITDPELNAWFTSMGNEIGDLCAYNYGTNTWDSGKANQAWNGHFYELQREFDNHASSTCLQLGP